MGKGMGKERRKPQTLTVEQFEVFRTRLDERGNVPPPTAVQDSLNRLGRTLI
jgi:hypothetical protein